MTDQQLTRRLVERIFGWRVGPGRFLKSNRAWTPWSKFVPTSNLKDAFALLDAAAYTYALTRDSNGIFHVEIRIDKRSAKASGKDKARTICLTLATALGITSSTEDGACPLSRGDFR